MSKMDLEEFDTHVSSYGYDFVKKTSALNGPLYSYVEYDKLDTNRHKRVITVLLGSKVTIAGITYVTSFKNEYSKFKNETRALGFKLYKTDEIEDNDNIKSSTIKFYYRKDKQRIIISNRFNSYIIAYASSHR